MQRGLGHYTTTVLCKRPTESCFAHVTAKRVTGNDYNLDVCMHEAINNKHLTYFYNSTDFHRACVWLKVRGKGSGERGGRGAADGAAAVRAGRPLRRRRRPLLPDRQREQVCGLRGH